MRLTHTNFKCIIIYCGSAYSLCSRQLVCQCPT